MSADIFGGHGGDSGGDFPNPNTTYETPSKAKKRRINKSKNLDDVFEANGKKPLPIQFEIDSRDYIYNAVGPNANMFTKYIGNLIELGIPPYYLSWDHVPQEFKKPILPRLRHFFNLDRSLPEWPLIVAGIERECQYFYKDKKRRLKRHFDQIGGYHDVGNAQRNPPPQLDHKAWCKTVKLFLSPEYMNRLMENTEIYPARIDHEHANEAKIVKKVPKLKGSAFSSFLKPPQPPAMPPTHDTMKLLIEYLNDYMQYARGLYDELCCKYPRIRFPPPPTIDTQALLASVMPQQKSHQPSQHDDDDDDDGDYDDDDDGGGDGDDDDGGGDDDDETDSYDD